MIRAMDGSMQKIIDGEEMQARPEIALIQFLC